MGLIEAARAWWLRQRPRFRRLLAKVNRRVPPGLRLLLGVVLMAGGVLGFLPVLGFWMLPLGAGIAWLDLRAIRKARRPAATNDDDDRGGGRP